MKLLGVVAASIAALASAGGSFRKGDAKAWSPDQQVPNKFGGKSKYGDKSKYGSKGKTFDKSKWSKYKNKKKKPCTLATVPKSDQVQYEHQFQALDTDHNGSLDASEFKDMGVQITKAFSQFRTNHYSRPTWKHSWGKGKGKGKDTGGYQKKPYGGKKPYNKGGDNQNKQQNPWGQKDNNNRRNRGNRGFGGRQLGGSHSKKSKSGNGADFWKYLQSKGFIHKQTQADKDKAAGRRAAMVFYRFDQDHNHSVSECEYANAMYKTKQLEAKLNKYKKKSNDVVVVHG